MSEAIPELERLASVAAAQGRVKVEAVCRLALARISELELEVRRVRGNATKGAQTRLVTVSPDRRRQIARLAAQRRWQRPHA